MDDGAAAPVRWWRPGLLGMAAGVPIAWAVWAFTADVASADGLGAIVVFLGYGPVIVIAVAAVSCIALWEFVRQRAQRWRLSWVLAAPFAMWVVLLVGAITSGPSGSTTEQRLGWALVVLLMYGAAGVGFGRGASRRVRVLASVVAVAAAPLMIAYDDASQYRWRKATYASAPHVLPVVPGYTVAAARADGPALEVDMRGPADLRVSVWRCRDCTVRQEHTAHALTVVDGSFELDIVAVGIPAGQWSAPDGIRVRPASTDELASLPLAAPNYVD
ncbi:hypothetical protein GCM10010170_051210 [Dactylosporangium salmoneum]|uniref:Uncharacterized protein n=2 Tax=Dactylosporangium salmoneum TaxID=53361 RepID=A0ABN3GPV8_9ACTN